MPGGSLSLALRLVCLYSRPVSAELDRLSPSVLKLRTHVGSDEVAGFDSLETMLLQQLRVLCFQQSAGNSAGPEIDVAATFFADRLLDGHVGDLHPSSWPKDTEDFCKHGVLIWNEIDHAIGDHDVDAVVREG
jgi:hypothetical protein